VIIALRCGPFERLAAGGARSLADGDRIPAVITEWFCVHFFAGVFGFPDGSFRTLDQVSLILRDDRPGAIDVRGRNPDLSPDYSNSGE
jgi:hypothetical protein